MTDIQIAWAIIAVGFLGCIVPLLPGPPLVWLGAAFYAYRTDWNQVGIPILVVLLVLALVGSTADIWMSSLGAKKTGASRWATIASLLGGFVGLIVASIPGLIIGSIGAIALVEYSQHKDWNKVLKASGGYLAGYALSIVVQILVCLAMAGIFALAVRF